MSSVGYLTQIRHRVIGKTQKEHMDDARRLIRRNRRGINRQIEDIQSGEKTTLKELKLLKKLPQRTLQERRHVQSLAKMLGKAIVGARKQVARLQTGAAQLDSIQMQMNEAFGRQKIQMSMKSATGIMRNVNSLVKIPELTHEMRMLSEHLTGAGVIEEMVGDMLPDGELEEFEEGTEAEISQVLTQILGEDIMKEEEQPAPELPEPVQRPVEEMPSVELEDPEERLHSLQGRLDALRS